MVSPYTFFRQKTDNLYSHRTQSDDLFYLSSPLPPPLHLPLVCPVCFVNSAAKFFRLSIGCHPLDGVIRGALPHLSDASDNSPRSQRIRDFVPIALYKFTFTIQYHTILPLL